MTVLEIISSKVANDAITELNKEVAIEEVEQVIKNYCSIEEVPEALKYTWANMAVDLINYNYAVNAGKSGDDLLEVDPSDVSSIKVGDTQIQLGGGSGERAKTLNSHSTSLDHVVMNYSNQLNKFRRMVW